MSTFLDRLDDYSRYAGNDQMTKFAFEEDNSGLLYTEDPSEYMDDAAVAKRLHTLAKGKLRQNLDAYSVRHGGGMSVPYIQSELTSKDYDPSDTEDIFKEITRAGQFDWHNRNKGRRSALLSNPNMAGIRDQYMSYMNNNLIGRIGSNINWWDPTGATTGILASGVRGKFQDTGKVGPGYMTSMSDGSAHWTPSEMKAMQNSPTTPAKQEQTDGQPGFAMPNMSEGMWRYMLPALGTGLPLSLLLGLGGKGNWILPLLALLGLGGFGYGYAKNKGWEGYQPIENLVDQFHSFAGTQPKVEE